jgi:hypothetical protein
MILDKVQFFVGGSFLKTKKIKASAAFKKTGPRRVQKRGASGASGALGAGREITELNGDEATGRFEGEAIECKDSAGSDARAGSTSSLRSAPTSSLRSASTAATSSLRSVPPSSLRSASTASTASTSSLRSVPKAQTASKALTYYKKLVLDIGGTQHTYGPADPRR